MNAPTSTSPGSKQVGSRGATVRTGRRGRVVVGVDGSDSSLRALRWALRRARQIDCDVQVVACWTWPDTDAGYGPGPDLDMSGVTRARVTAAVRAELAALADDRGLSVATTVLQGDPAVRLSETAKGADLLVVGARRRSGFRGLLARSVGRRCARRALCPVMMISPQQAR